MSTYYQYYNNHEITTNYKTLAVFELLQQRHKDLNFDEEIIRVKRDLRRELQRYKVWGELFENCELFKSMDDDWQTTHESYIKHADSREEMQEWADRLHEDNQIHSIYDCTGKRFIISVRFAHIENDKYRVRVTWGLDV